MTIDLSTIPLVAASVASRNIIARMLNPRKYLPTDDNMPRDYRGLAYLLDFNNEIMSILVSHADPIMHIFTLLNDKQHINITMKVFQEIMEKIDRWDIIRKTRASLETDAIKYLKQQEKAQISADKVIEEDQDILTLADIYRSKQGLGAQHYDAFLLYADDDIDFVNEMVQKLETEYELKLCLKHRDLINGVFEHDAIMKLITERCNRLLIIVSPNFLNCSANKFLISFTQALSIEKRQRILIPCIYKRCELPIQLKYIYNLDYNCKGMYDFWGKLSNSIKAPSSSVTSCIKQETSKCTFSDKHISQPQVQEIAALNCPEKKIENCAITKMNDTEAINNNSKKNMKLLRWIKTTGNSKTKQTKQNSPLIKKTIMTIELDNLPSVDNLDSLHNLSSSNIREKKKNIFKRFKKKSKAEEVAMKI